jgi:hypothetical protein
MDWVKIDAESVKCFQDYLIICIPLIKINKAQEEGLSSHYSQFGKEENE